jgi:FkbM family methyltransferase
MSSSQKNRIAALRVKFGVYFYAISDTLLGALFSFVSRFDNSFFRRARFDTNGRGHEFLFTDRGPEKFIVITSDQALSRPVFVYGNYEFGKFEKVVSLLKSRGFMLGTLVDVGANIGTICIAAVKRGYASRAIAIEPESKNYRALVSNIYLNDLADKIVPFNLALGDTHDQTLTLELSTENSGDHRIRVSSEEGISAEEKRQTVVVRSDTFDSAVPKVDKTYLIWMDTQGYEGTILQGARNALASRVPMVVEFWPYGMKRANSYAALRAAVTGYSQYYDLSEREPRPVDMSDSALDSLYQRLEEKGINKFTDILLV